jgi:two-component system LytT family response regulator
MIAKTLKVLEQHNDPRFLRSHKIHLVNRNHVQRINYDEQQQILLSNDEQVPLSLRRRNDFIQAF